MPRRDGGDERRAQLGTRAKEPHAVLLRRGRGLQLADRGGGCSQACCNPLSNCAGGFPVQCSQQCSDLWLPFIRDCGAFVAEQPGLSELGQACHSTRKVDSGTTDVMGCPTGYVQYGYNCYLFSLDRADYNTAEKACEALGGELACINDAAENTWLTSQLTGDDDYWIGLNDRNHEGEYEWSNAQCTSPYTNWLPVSAAAPFASSFA